MNESEITAKRMQAQLLVTRCYGVVLWWLLSMAAICSQTHQAVFDPCSLKRGWDDQPKRTWAWTDTHLQVQVPPGAKATPEAVLWIVPYWTVLCSSIPSLQAPNG